jgi:2,4-dienoyl-CoA reductase-like NADH-dependent reductase (Old Yellow Enzyme family)/thioredoxin reductase
MNEFPHLAEPIRLRHLTLRNRVVFGAHTANMSEAGLPGARHLGYYRERARGGAAMIVVEPVPVHRTAVLTRGNFLVGDDAVVPGFRGVTEACHDEGAAMIQQLYHVGQHGDWDNSYQPSWSPSGLPSNHDPEGSHAMTEREIREVIDGFVDAADRARRCGFDGVEVFAAYHSLVDQFWTPWSNRRTDGWGGSLDNRMRFGREVLEGIRQRCGDDFVVGLAVSVDTGAAAALQIDELCEVVAWHDERGLVDYVTCGTGSYFGFETIIPTFQQPPSLGVPFAAALKGAVRHALVQAESHVRTPAAAEAVLAAGHADLVSIVRGQIADPNLVTKALTGRAEQVRGCISCNQLCWGRRSRDYWISCLVNPSVGREHEWGGDVAPPAQERRSVLVVGGGPAGLEAARTAAERGHRVALVEADTLLGGAFRLAGLQPQRGQILDLVAWYERELERLDVRVVLGRALDTDGLAVLRSEVGADDVIVATGGEPAGTGFQRSLPLQDELPGVDRPDVWSVEDVMRGDAQLGHRVVVIDDLGDWRGGGTALHLAQLGHEVTVVTSFGVVGATVARTAGDGRLRIELARLGAGMLTESVVVSWGDDGAVVRSKLGGTEQLVAADSLVLALVGRPRPDLLDAVADGDAVALGDAVAARSAAQAIYEARAHARTL